MIVITGASDGVGHEIAKLYKQAGTMVVNISRRECPVADHNFLYDLSEGKNIQAAAKDVKGLEQTIEAIINSVGVYTEEEFGDITEAEINRTMSTNVKGPMLLVSELIGRIKSDGADVLNIVSKAGMIGSAHNPVYAASKWAERGFTLSLQEQLKQTPCRVISFCPGGIKTDIFDKADSDVNTDNWMDPAAIALLVKQILDLPKNIEVGEILINRKAVA